MRRYENVDINKLIPYENNARTHSPEQVEKLAKSIEQFGFINPVLIDGNFGIIAGHGRVQGAKQLGLKEVPCIFVEDLTEAQKRAYILADNKLALDAGWDDDLLKVELEALKELNFDISLTGFTMGDIDISIGDPEKSEEDDKPLYTQRVDIPQYQITGECPELSELVDTEKADEFIEEIKSAAITDEQKDFLIKATKRLYTFNYRNIAEYYAHQDKEMQGLMEKLALVIIDINDAIKNGYAKLSAEIQEMCEEDGEEE
jgi:ParB-like chromosome segregation protein Spo0J